ncbi:hypothetical protein AGATL06_26230 [Agathobaculum sp. TL06]
MYQVFVVDDESIILEGICSMVAWEELGLSLAGTAMDGSTAYQAIEKLQPDIILTDICMPGMDGLEMLRKILSLPYKPIVMIISGYNEFDYAKRALQLGVFDYISKPIDIGVLQQQLAEIVRQLEQKKTEQDQLDIVRSRAEKLDDWEVKTGLRRYIAGSIDESKLLELLPQGFPTDYFIACLIIQIENFDDLTNRMKGDEIFVLTEQLEQTIYYSSHRPPILIEDVLGKYVLFWISKEEQEANMLRDTAVRWLRINWKECAYVTATTEVSKGITRCRQLYKEASEALYQMFLKGGNQDYVYHAPVPNDTLQFFDYGKLIQAIATFEKEKIRRELDLVEKEIRQAGANSFLLTRMIVSNIFTETIHLLSDMQTSVGMAIDVPETSYKKVLNCMTLTDMMQELYHFIAEICDIVNQEKKGSSIVMILQAKAYLQANFQDPKLTLEMVAKQVNVSTNYFSLLFKQVMGQSFVSYLTELRLQYAKQLLLSSDYRSYEISYRCGYENATYFSTIFKKYFGVSPKEYRRKYREEEQQLEKSIQ